MKKNLVLITSALMAIGLLAGCGNKHVHKWGEVVYEWSIDHTSCTATRVCEDNESHKETETKDSVYAVTKEAKCEEDGSGRYTVTFDNEAFGTTHFDITLEAIGHEWGAITYTWAEDNSTCTARRVCAHDATHVDTETVNSIYVVVEEAKCEEDGKGRYAADFTREAFADQTKDITLEAIGHDLTAHDAHAETCKKAGNSAYWSCERCGKFFSDAEGKNEIENDSWIIPAHAHDLIHNDAKAATCYVPGNIEYWVCKECFQYFSDEACTHPINQEDVRTPAHHTLTHHEAKAATRLEDGNIEYWSCERCGKAYSDAEGENEIENDSWIIPALGTDKSYFVGTRWNGNGLRYTLYLDSYTTYYDSKDKINYRYIDFNYDDDTKELSFTISTIENYNIYTPKYSVDDVLTFIYNAEEDVLTFEGMTFVKSSF